APQPSSKVRSGRADQTDPPSILSRPATAAPAEDTGTSSATDSAPPRRWPPGGIPATYRATTSRIALNAAWQAPAGRFRRARAQAPQLLARLKSLDAPKRTTLAGPRARQRCG